MTTAIATRDTTAEAIEQVLIGGDLSRLSPTDRVLYYNRVCESLGLNPLTKPFAYLKLNGKEVLYALRDAAEQLRKLHGVSIVAVESAHVGDVFVVTAKAQDKTGRTDASTGAVAIGNLKGEALANALMKAETKAKRRVTLSICGLGMLDETEVETVPQGGYTVTGPTRTETMASGAMSGSTITPETPQPAQHLTNGLGDASTLAATPPPPDGLLRIARIDRKPTKNPNVTKLLVILSDGRECSTINTALGNLAEQLCQDGDPVEVETKPTKWGEDLLNLRRVTREIQIDHTAPITDDECPF